MALQSCLPLMAVLGLGLAGVAGCGQNSGNEQAETNKPASGENAPNDSKLPVAAITSSDSKPAEDDGDDPLPNDLKMEEPQQGSVEWLIREATKLRLQAPPKTTEVDQLREDRKQRNEGIVSLMKQAIAKTHADPQKERLFNVSVHHLMEARLQLALMGDDEKIGELYEDAKALWERDRQSQAAAEGAYALVSLAYNNARNTPGDTEWLMEFHRQAKHYASNFPKEEMRALPLLFTAARSCENYNKIPEAIEAYTIIQTKYPRSQFAPRVAGILRRLRLPGNPVQLDGQTLDGEQFSVDDQLGRVVLVVFWGTEAKPFLEQLPLVQAAQKKFTKQGLSIVGINLDLDPMPVSQFVMRQQLNWTNIFFKDPEKRGWNNPIANYYGLMEIPSYWIIDQNGTVVSTTLKVEELDPVLTELLNPGTAKKPAPADSGE